MIRIFQVKTTEPYVLIRNCTCGGKKKFFSTEKFRVNANKKNLDVWLIYTCEKCGHTYNLPILKRVNPLDIPTWKLDAFLNNDMELANLYSKNASLIKKYSEIAKSDVVYNLIEKNNESNIDNRDMVIIENHDGLRLRNDKLVQQIFGITRKEAKKSINDGIVTVNVETNGNIIITKTVMRKQKEGGRMAEEAVTKP